jgi:glycosyltransferase involved in cell wall biosynthesis
MADCYPCCTPSIRSLHFREPSLSIVIPVRNGGDYLRRCVAAIASSSFSDYELILVDDASDEELSSLPFNLDLRVLRLQCPVGPAVARNRGAETARAPLILFLDVDVLVSQNTIQQIVNKFEANPDLDAIFGSYDASPWAENFVSQYRNLLHHFVHQHSQTNASTFWTGCGAIRRHVFQNAGGFCSSYGRPSIEDIELGLRLVDSGHRIELDPAIQVKHLKRWTFWQMLKCDVFDRGIPWTRLILASGHMPNDLNLKLSQRISCGLTYGLMFVLLWGVWKWSDALLIACAATLSLFMIDYWTQTKRIPDCMRWLGVAFLLGCALLASTKLPVLFTVAIALILAVVAINHQFYMFLCRSKYPLFAVAAFPLHILFFIYCGISLGLGVISHYWRPKKVLPLIVRGNDASDRRTKERV